MRNKDFDKSLRKSSKQDKRRKNILLVFFALSCILLIICLAEFFRLGAGLRERGGLLNQNGKIAAADLGEADEAGITGISGEKAGGAVPDRAKPQDSDGDMEEHYPDKCGLDSVDPPKKRTRREVLSRLEKLGEDSELIEDIYQNRSDYPDKLLEALANNPEMADFVSRWQGLQKSAQGGLTDSEKEQDFPLFLQWDPRWGYVEYGDKSCIGLAGCGPVCLSMALYYLTGDESVTPDRVGEYSMNNGCYIPGTGTAWALMEAMPQEYGINVRQPAASESEMKTALDNGAVIILSMGPGDFTAAGHFIVVYGYDRDGFKVNDPNCVARSRKQWDYSEFGTQIKNMWVLSDKVTVEYIEIAR